MKAVRLFLALMLATFGAVAVDSAQAEPAQAACYNPTPKVGLSWNDSTNKTWGWGQVKNCGGRDRACVRVVWGHAVPPNGFMYEQVAVRCINIPVGTLSTFSTPKASCYPGYYYAQLRIWNNRSSGGFHAPGWKSTRTTNMYDLTGCYN